MKPRLLPKDDTAGTPNNHLNSVITRPYEFDGETFYFSLYPELYPEGNALDFTGRYLAVLLSIRGLETFYLAPDESGCYVMDDDDSESSQQIDMEIEGMLQDVEGVHTMGQDSDITEGEQDEPDEEESDSMDWLEFDSEVLMLPLMNQAITEDQASI